MTDNLEGTKSAQLSTMTQTWVRRLQPQVAATHDSFVIVGGPPKLIGHRIALDRGSRTIHIGRGPLNEDREPSAPLHLPSDFVAKSHASLEATRDGWNVVDLGSQNRTYVGTVKIDRHRLVFGDEVRIGDFMLLFVPAALDHVPINVVDYATGLLTPRVMIAEISQLAEETVAAGEPDFGLLLIQIEGLRDQLLFASGLETTPTTALGEKTSTSSVSLRNLGRALLQALPEGVAVSRLENALFGAAWGRITPEELAQQAQLLSKVLLEVGLPLELGLPTFVTAPRRGQSLTGPQALTAALSTLEALLPGQRGTVIEADMASSGRMLRDQVLINQLIKAGAGTVLLAAVQDEDYLLHQIGHQRLDGLRWNVRKAVLKTAGPGGIAGVLDDRVFVLWRDDVSVAKEQLREALSELGPHTIQLVSYTMPAEITDREEISRRMRSALAAAGEGFAPGQREPVNRLPTPIAGPYRLIWVASSESARIKLILDAFDCMMRFVALAGLSVAAASDEASRSVARRAVQSRLKKCLPLGEWMGLLRDISPCLGDTEDPIAETLRQVLGSNLRRSKFMAAANRELLPFRNYFAHGPMVPCEKRFEQVAGELLPRLNEIVRALAPLRGLELISVIKTEPKRHSTKVWSRVLTDARENFEVRVVSFRDKRTELYPGSCYLASPDYRSVAELHPFVKFGLCPQCEREEIFLAAGIPRFGATMEMMAVTTGHRLRWDPTDDDFPEGLLEVVG
jgi:pSer/pThr/pTyr-binding forkhead associated (FHA) protein